MYREVEYRTVFESKHQMLQSLRSTDLLMKRLPSALSQRKKIIVCVFFRQSHHSTLGIAY